MTVASLTPIEELRLETLYSYNILDTPQESDFDKLVELAYHITGCPMIAISFIDRDRQWLKAQKGLGIDSIDRGTSLCTYTNLEEQEIIIEDLLQDSRFSSHPMVAGGFCFRFYAGIKISSPNGLTMGTLCMSDTVPRSLTESQVAALRLITQQVCTILETRLQNNFLRKRAEELITLEQRTVQHNLVQQESERQQIGYRLHEGFAQTLAACHALMTHAEQNEAIRLRTIQLTRKELHQLIHEVRDYSRAITPTTMRRVDLADMLSSLIDQTRTLSSITIRLEVKGRTERINREAAMGLYRNVQEFLTQMQENGNASSVLIRLKVGSSVSLLLMDNRTTQSQTELEKNTLVRTMHNRTLHFNGTVRYKPFSVKGNAMLIALPNSN